MGHSREWLLRRRRRRLRRNRRYGDKAAFHGINWDWYSHEQLYEFATSADPGAMRQQARDWIELSRAIGDTTSRVRGIVSGLLQTWQGASAAQAGASNESLTQWAQGASETAQRIGIGLQKYADAAEFAKANMPPPDSGERIEGFVGGLTHPNSAVAIMTMTEDHKLMDDRKRAGKAEAVRVMKQYGSESQDVHNTMPWFYDGPADAPPAVEPVGDPPPSGTPGPGPDQPVVPQPEPPGSSTTTTSAFSPAGGVPVEGGTGGYFAGAPGSPGGGADAVRGGGGNIGSGPLAARGPVGPGGGALPGGRGGLGAAGVGGTAFPPVGGAGAGAPREEDTEHKTKYVEPEDWLDDELPPFHGGVIGAW